MTAIIKIIKPDGESIDLRADWAGKVSGSYTSNVTNNPIQTAGLSLPGTDNISVNAPEFSIDLAFSDQTGPNNDDRELYAYKLLLLEVAQKSGFTCVLITKEFTRKDLKITGFTYSQSSESGNRLNVSISFRRIQIVQSKTATVPAVKKVGKPKANAATKLVKKAQVKAQQDRFTPKSNKGSAGGGSPSAKVTAKTKEVKKSYLASLADAGGSFIKGLLP
jgi:hypothetical protein